MIKLILILMLTISCQSVLASDVDDIKCTISKVTAGGKRERIVEDRNIPDFKDKWTIIDLNEREDMALACESFSVKGLRCGVLISQKGKIKEEFNTTEDIYKNGVLVASESLIDLMTKNYSVTCYSESLYTGQTSGPNKDSAPKRNLEKNELTFCEQFKTRNFGMDADDRILCVSILQSLKKPLSTEQMNFCSGFNRDIDGFGIDTRLSCIMQFSSN